MTMYCTNLGTPLCPTSVTVYAGADVVNVTWQQATLPQVTFTTVTYCPTSSPNCGNSVNCTSPCTICGLDPGTEYQFTVIPNNICGVPTGCTGHNATAETTCEFNWILIVCACTYVRMYVHVCTNVCKYTS